jgi:hypothetical protein
VIDPALGRCRAHPALDIDAVRCARCGRQLCSFHIQLMPRAKSNGTIGHTERCFPSCASTFGAPRAQFQFAVGVPMRPMR